SDYTFAVRGRNGDLSTIGKAYSGLTDREIADLTVWFLAHKTGGVLAGNSRAMRVEPSIVLDVAFDVIQKSALHQSGFALRFPRIVLIRDDKPATEIDSIERVEELYKSMLQREGLDP
ncbi:MAG: ATP-dependent DNA ligase, partial [Candidatus Eremiobacteraeota bacterium]|nr:ATP-dependent DNA ligase [Candidatus Eremiobacteraeota bacterium]